MRRRTKRNRSTMSSAKLAALFLTTLFALFCITTIRMGIFVHNLDRGLLNPSSDTASTRKNNISPHDERCAILFFGVPRRLKDIGYTAIKLYILDANPQCDGECSVFMCCLQLCNRKDSFDLLTSHITYYIICPPSVCAHLQCDKGCRIKSWRGWRWIN